MPGPIVNKPVADKIAKRRKDTGYKINDERIQLKDSTEVYSLDYKFWGYFAETYGYDIAIQNRKYENPELTMPQNIDVKNREWISFKIDPAFHYNIYYEHIMSLPLTERLDYEAKCMDQIQNDSDLPRLYALDTIWIQNWLDWVQGDGKNKPPGPITNDQLFSTLFPDKYEGKKRVQSPKGEPTYFNVSKTLFYFFVSLYGGGPTIVKNEEF